MILPPILSYSILVYVTILSPVWAYGIWVLNRLFANKNWYLIAEASLFALTVWFGFNPAKVFAVSHWLHYYFLFLMIYVFLIGFKYRFQHFNKVLAISLWLIFVAGDFWEWPVFFWDFISKILGYAYTYSGLPGQTITIAWMYSHVRRVYTIFTWILLIMLSRMDFRRQESKVLLLSCLGISLVLTSPSVMLWNGWATGTLARLFTLHAFGIIAFIGLPDQDAQ